jgi:hypothetical protein
MNIIPLGDHCVIAMALKELNMRTSSYPFDWIASNGPDPTYSSLETTIDLCIELLQTHDSEYICSKLLGNSICDTNKIYNNIMFPHDQGTIDEINQKYLRRLNRLHDDILDNSKYNLIILITRCYFLPKEKIATFIGTLQKMNIRFHILFFSGIQHDYCDEFEQAKFKYIHYDMSKFWDWDYSHFRPQLKYWLTLSFDEMKEMKEITK